MSFKFNPTTGNLDLAGSGGGAGTVTSVGSGTGLTGGPITTSGTLALANTAVTPGSYTNSTITVDAQGRLLSASNGTGGTGNTLSIPTTTSSSSGVILQNSIPVFQTFGTSNFFFGSNAGNFTTSGTGLNLGLGDNALNALTTGGANVAVGKDALKLNTSGNSNVALGYNAASSSTIANNVVAIGNGALSSNSASSNIAIGSGAGSANTSGSFNIYLGESAGSSVATSGGVMVLGHYADVTGTGADVTAVGFQAARFLTTATGVTALGGSAGTDTSAGGVANTSGSYNTYLGFQANGTAGTFSNSTALGYLARATASNQVVLGNSSVTEVYVPGQIKIVGGTPGVGKVLTSDAAGLATWQAGGGGGGGANTALSNLAATAINADLIPGLANTYDLGSAALGFKQLVLTNALLSSSAPNYWFGTSPALILKGDSIVQTQDEGSGELLLATGARTGVGATPPTGNLTIVTGDHFGTGPYTNTGNLSLFSGTNSGAGRSGSINIGSGNSEGSGAIVGSGQVNIFTGHAVGDEGSGVIIIQTGQVLAAGTSKSGSIEIKTGVNQGTSDSGSVNITTGNVLGVGAAGSIILSPSKVSTGAVSVVRIESHLQLRGTLTAPTIAVTASAGTGATATLSQASDTVGKITITTGTVGVATGSYATVTFNRAYLVAPICLMSPANSTLSSSVYVTSTTTTMDINFAVAGGTSSTYVINYFCVEA